MRRVSRALAAVVLALVCSCSGGSTGFNPGDKAPEIKGTDSKGNSVALSQYQGKVTLLNFWATWCAPCVAELPLLQTIYDTHKDKGFQIVAIAVDDTPEAVQKMKDTVGLTFPIIIDTDSQSKRKYGIQGLPESFVLDAQQQVLVVNDPDGKSGPVTRIIGPRAWKEKWVAQFLPSSPAGSAAGAQ
jgi:cytochrome c biogenesis protein CcmG, thiol:disulfide interchange protein DsbE